MLRLEGNAPSRSRYITRRTHPVKQWKISLIDAVAQKHWNDYSIGRHEILARLSVIKDLLARLDYADKDHDLIHPNPDVVVTYVDACLANGTIAP